MQRERVRQWKLVPLEVKIVRYTTPFPEAYRQPAIFNFLNLTASFSSIAQIDWNYSLHGKLWTYNLSYFEVLRQPGLDPRIGQALINDWISKETTHIDGWEPYSLSLRMINWIQFFRITDSPIPEHVIASLIRQETALWQQLEYRLDGNHLLENAYALAYVARCTGDGKHREDADYLLLSQIKEQYLADGAHYQLSVMYQLTLSWRGLDLFSLLKETDTLRSILQEKLERQLSYLLAICDDAGYFPHFNDATSGIAPSLESVLRYAESLGLSLIRGALSASGYRRWSWAIADLWIDVAAIGPDHVVGHTHADNLTFCLNVGAKPIIVDTGTSTYENNERRRLERSTAAHNTVEIAARSSSDVWAQFRVGRRAQTIVLEDNLSMISAEQDGYDEVHHRIFTRHKAGFTITDKIVGRGVAYLHFDYRVQPKITADVLKVGLLTIKWTDAEVRLGPYQQAIAFNSTVPAQRLAVTFADLLTMTYNFD